MIFYKMLKRIKKQRDNDAASSQAYKKRLCESNEILMSCPIMKRPMRMQIVSSQLLFYFVIFFFFQICRNMSTSALCYSILNYFLIHVSRDANNKFSVINYFVLLANL